MALNCSVRPIIPAHVFEDNLAFPMRIVNGYLVEGGHEKNAEDFAWARHSQSEVVNDHFDVWKERADQCGSPEEVSTDIIDRLPTDPFGMDINTTFTAIQGWLEDLKVDYGSYHWKDEGPRQQYYSLFPGFSLIWNNAMNIQSLPADIQVGEIHERGNESNRDHEAAKMGNVTVGYDAGSSCNTRDVVDAGVVGCVLGPQFEENGEEAVSHIDDGVAPHEALFYAVGRFGVKDLLTVGRVCSSLYSYIRDDPLLWRSIHIDQPLNDRITDDILVQLTSRAQGNLRCLTLMECSRITDNGLRRVLESNPRLLKLCVPGCTKLTIEGLISMLREFNRRKGTEGIKYLRIGGLYGMTQEHFEELKMLLGAEEETQTKSHKPHFYVQGNFYLLCDDDRAMDVEICPRCQKLRLLYDCPSEGCQQKDTNVQQCRACTLCIARCFHCGRCINDNEYEETFCLELLCSDCFKQLHECHEGRNQEVIPANVSSGHECFIYG